MSCRKDKIRKTGLGFFAFSNFHILCVTKRAKYIFPGKHRYFPIINIITRQAYLHEHKRSFIPHRPRLG